MPSKITLALGTALAGIALCGFIESGFAQDAVVASIAESEAEETRVWIEFSLRCGYLSSQLADELDQSYDAILGQLVRMLSEPSHWTIRQH